MKKILYLSFALLLVLNCTSCIFFNDLEDFFEEWIPENDSSIAIVRPHGDCINCEGQAIKADFLDLQVIGDRLVYMEGNTVYGVKDEINSKDEDQIYRLTVQLYSVDLKSQKEEVLYSGKYCPRKGKAINIKSYYFERNIIICDETVTTVYNLDTGAVQNLSAAELSSVYKPKYTVERIFINESKYDFDYRKIKIKGDSEERIITPEYMGERNEYARKLLELDVDNLPFSTEYPLDCFFNSFYVICDKIYIVCRVLDIDGESNAVIFSYDYEKDEFEFIYHEFTFDIPDFYPIPRIA